MNNKVDVVIRASDDDVLVKITVDGKEQERLAYGTAVGDGYLTGADLSDVLAACGIQADYEYVECDCEDRSWYGGGHDSQCPVTAARLEAGRPSEE